MNNQSLPINQLASKTLPISDLRLRTTAYSLLIVALHYLTYPEKVLTSGNLHNHLNRYFRRTTARRSATSNLIKKNNLLDSEEFSNLGTSGGRVFQISFLQPIQERLQEIAQTQGSLVEKIEYFMREIHVPVLTQQIEKAIAEYKEFVASMGKDMPNMKKKQKASMVETRQEEAIA